jgi:hypothetical protein
MVLLYEISEIAEMKGLGIAFLRSRADYIEAEENGNTTLDIHCRGAEGLGYRLSLRRSTTGSRWK